MKTQLYVWDLHGTLEQGNEQAVVELSNRILEQFGYVERFTPKMGIELYGLKWHQYFRTLIPDLSDDAAYGLQSACFDLSAEDTDIQLASIVPTPHSDGVLREIGRHQRQILLSNTRVDTLPIFVRHLGLDRYFQPRDCVAVDNHSVTDRTKAAIVKSLLQNNSFDEIVVIGDSKSDMDLAEAVGAVGVLYNHPYLARKDCAASYYIDDLRAVLDCLSRA